MHAIDISYLHQQQIDKKYIYLVFSLLILSQLDHRLHYSVLLIKSIHQSMKVKRHLHLISWSSASRSTFLQDLLSKDLVQCKDLFSMTLFLIQSNFLVTVLPFHDRGC